MAIFFKINHIHKLYSVLKHGVVVIVCEKILHPMRLLKSTTFVKGQYPWRFACADQHGFVVVFVEIRNELYQCAAVAFALVFLVCSYVFQLAAFAVDRQHNANTFQIIVV